MVWIRELEQLLEPWSKPPSQIMSDDGCDPDCSRRLGLAVLAEGQLANVDGSLGLQVPSARDKGIDVGALGDGASGAARASRMTSQSKS